MNENISIVVLAAGMGSRYGGLKQMDGLGPNGETILEYSIYDAIEAGFNKVVFIVRDFFREDFAQQVASKFSNQIEVAFAEQPVNIKVEGIDLVEREKPWGTAHAVLVSQGKINEPFAVINADDYYGKSAFHQMAHFLKTKCSPKAYAMAGYVLKNTMSDQGTVNRGICTVNTSGYLEDIVETLKIGWKDGTIVHGLEKHVGLSPEAVVSMNFWGFHQSHFDHLAPAFFRFVKSNSHIPKAEYYIPDIVDELIKSKEVTVEVLTSNDSWYGVTYKEDAETVRQAFSKFVENGEYPSHLWE